MPSKSLLGTVIDIIDKRGKDSLEQATQRILQNTSDGSKVSEALKYYSEEIFPHIFPIFPALMHISCEAVGGKPEKTKTTASAMILITSSGDIHDDIIDGSTHKFGKKTMFGKYGRDITLLAGDALLIQGMGLLQSTTSYGKSKRDAISKLITKAMFELALAEATETYLWKKRRVTSEECFEVIQHKGSVAELHCSIGGIIGGADKEALDKITHYGRTIGILSTMKDEFMDVTNFSELKNRLNNEMLPYPFICAFQEKSIRKKILPILKNKNFSKKDVSLIAKIVLNSSGVNQVRHNLKEMGQRELTKNPLLRNPKRGKEAAILLQFLANEL